MSQKSKGSNFHPARISGALKRIMEREVNKLGKKCKPRVKPLDLKKQDWSIK